MKTYSRVYFSLCLFLAISDRSRTQWKLNPLEKFPIYGMKKVWSIRLPYHGHISIFNVLQAGLPFIVILSWRHDQSDCAVGFELTTDKWLLDSRAYWTVETVVRWPENFERIKGSLLFLCSKSLSATLSKATYRDHFDQYTVDGIIFLGYQFSWFS